MNDESLNEEGFLMRALKFLGQTSTILGIVTVIGVIWKVKVPEVQLEAILEFAGVVLLFQQFLKDAPSATSIGKWFLQPTTLRAIVLSVSVIINRAIPQLTLDRILEGAAVFLGLIEIVTNELSRSLIFVKDKE